jgi:capsular exopolysaccharide synthesis family protein
MNQLGDTRQPLVLRALRRSGIAVLAFALVVAAAAYLLARQQDKEYTNSALVQISTGEESPFIETIQSTTNLYLTLAKTARVTLAAGDRVGLSQQQFAALSSVESEPEVSIIRLKATADDPRTSARYANAYANAFIDYVTRTQDRERQRALTQIQERIDLIERRLANARGDALTNSLTTSLQTLQTEAAETAAAPRDTALLVQAGFGSEAVASPNPTRNAILAFIVAFVIATALALARERFADHYASPEEAEADLGLPVIAVIPDAAPQDRGLREAFRGLRVNVLFGLRQPAPAAAGGGGAARDGAGAVLLVTGSEPRAGKTYVASNLARSLAAGDSRVAIVDGDLRRPTLHEEFDVGISPGLHDAVAGETWARDAARLVQHVDDDITGRELAVMTAGRASDEAAEMLGTENVHRLIEEMRDSYDAVVIDSPPIGAVDPLVMVRYSDGVLVVINARRSRRRDARWTVQSLRALGAPLLGVVYNRERRRGRTYGYYTADS